MVQLKRGNLLAHIMLITIILPRNEWCSSAAVYATERHKDEINVVNECAERQKMLGSTDFIGYEQREVNLNHYNKYYGFLCTAFIVTKTVIIIL